MNWKMMMAAIVWIWLGTSGLFAGQFDSQGKRDPFLNLRSLPASNPGPQAVPPPPLRERPPGLAGLLVSEVVVSGTASAYDRRLVILKGVDEVSYIAREGTRLYDGFIQEINGELVHFARETVLTNGTRTSSLVVKRLDTEQK